MISTPSQRLAHMARFMSQPLRLVDGPLAITGDRATTVRRMASDLLRFDAWRNEQDAIRALFGRYPMFEILRLLDDARQLAMQDCVGEAMSEPCGRRGGNCQCTSVVECIHS